MAVALAMRSVGLGGTVRMLPAWLAAVPMAIVPKANCVETVCAFPAKRSVFGIAIVPPTKPV